MALDRELSLRSRGADWINVAEVERIAMFAAGRSCVVLADPEAKRVNIDRESDVIEAPLVREGTSSSIAFVIPAMSKARIVRAFLSSSAGLINSYHALEKEGIVVLSPVRKRGEALILSGGSLSSVTLELRDSEMVATKTIESGNDISCIDGIARHRAEANFLRLATKNSIGLFPQLVRLEDRSYELIYSTTFFPAYTAAELIFQGRMTGEQLGALVINVYEALRRKIYPLSLEGWRHNRRDANYVQTIRRRTNAMAASQGGDGVDVRRLMAARKVQVNGLDCVPYNRLLDIVESTPRWRDVLTPQGERRFCHGDLILEDILVDGLSATNFRLVDPNPYNQHPLFDVAKTLLSLMIGYEFFYFDNFEIEVKSTHCFDAVDVRVEVARGTYAAEYMQALKIFGEYVETDLASYLEIAKPGLGKQLRMAAALHALAIPWFHLVHHKRGERALAFVAAGLFHATIALDSRNVALEDGGWLG